MLLYAVLNAFEFMTDSLYSRQFLPDFSRVMEGAQHGWTLQDGVTPLHLFPDSAGLVGGQLEFPEPGAKFCQLFSYGITGLFQPGILGSHGGNAFFFL